MLSGRLIWPQPVGSVVTVAGFGTGGHTEGQLVPVAVTFDGMHAD